MAQFTDFRPFTDRLEPPDFFIFRLISVLLRHTKLLRRMNQCHFHGISFTINTGRTIVRKPGIYNEAGFNESRFIPHPVGVAEG
jgi:hypothetical protein